jgi:hypothetical protein
MYSKVNGRFSVVYCSSSSSDSIVKLSLLEKSSSKTSRAVEIDVSCSVILVERLFDLCNAFSCNIRRIEILIQ